MSCWFGLLLFGIASSADGFAFAALCTPRPGIHVRKIREDRACAAEVAADFKGRGIRACQVRKLLLESFQLFHAHVEFIVAHHGSTVNIVSPVGLV